MPRSPETYWSYVQSLAWIRWRKTGIERYFDHSDGPERWQDATAYPQKTISAPGLPTEEVVVVCDNPKSQLNKAVREGTIDLVEIKGLEPFPVAPAARYGLKLNLNSTASRGGELVALVVVFDARQIQARWPKTSQANEGRIADLEAVEAFLRERMKTSPGPGEMKDTLRKEVPRAISDKAWDEVFTRVAREINRDWSRPGRRTKTVDIVSPKSSRQR